MIRIDKHQWRVWVCGWRLHHGLLGCFLVGFGAVLIAHDWKDRWWV